MCTDFILPKTSGFRISGRTMDFSEVFIWQLVSIPAGTQFKAVKPFSKNHRLKWQAKYGCIGIGTEPKKEENKEALKLMLYDAMNTEGLSAAALWLPGSIYKAPKTKYKKTKYISAMDICGWAVSNYKTVNELKADLECIQNEERISTGERIGFWDPFQSDSNPNIENNETEITNQLPLHFQFHDRSGASLVLEFRDGELEITDNSDLGVMTNQPFIDWHRSNLQNTLGVTNRQEESKDIIGLNVAAAGNGSGTIGLTYSPLPASRYLRTVMNLNFSQKWLHDQSESTDKEEMNNAAIAHAMNVIGGIKVIHGQCVKYDKDEHKYVDATFTQWHMVRDHKNLKCFFAKTNSFGHWIIDFNDYALAQGDQVKITTLPNVTDMPHLKAKV